jgi:uncharacterized peroxidase-related enzyme
LKATEQKPIWLPEVEANPQPSPYATLIQTAKANGQEHWPIWNLLAFRPDVTLPLASFTEGVMRGPAPISPGLRELIAAYTSWVNRCEFCWRSHVEVAGALLGSEQLAHSVLADLETSALPEAEKALLRFARKMTLDPAGPQEADIEQLRRLNWSDEAIYYAVMVVALFNFYNRWVSACGVQPVSGEGHRLHCMRLARNGYAPAKRLAGIGASAVGE